MNNYLIKTIEKPKILILDDENSFLNLTKELLKHESIEIITTNSPLKAVELIKDQSFSIICSDYMMPKMNGIDFLLQAKEIAPNSIRILISAYSELNTILKAINKASVYRIIIKPYEIDDIKIILKEAMDFHKTKVENIYHQQIIEKEIKKATKNIKQLHHEMNINLKNTIYLLSDLIELKFSKVNKHLKRVSHLAHGICETINIPHEQIFEIEMASLLHDIGKIGIHSEILYKSKENLSTDEIELIKNHPIEASKLLQNIPYLENIANYVRHQNEKWDGTGYPDNLKGNLIPIGSRIIAVANAFDKYSHKILENNDIEKINKEFALREIQHKSETFFDPTIVDALNSYLHKHHIKDDNLLEVCFDDLNIGMTLAENLTTNNGSILITKKTNIEDFHLNALKKYFHNAKNINSIFVYR